MTDRGRRVTLVTGGSRGIGAATVLAFARRGFDMMLTYRNKATRADNVAVKARTLDVEVLPLRCDLTVPGDIQELAGRVRKWKGRLDVLILNASGGLERNLVDTDPTYPMRINRDAQIELLEAMLPLMPPGATVIFVTSHWAHLYGHVRQLPAYEPVAASKWAGEQALRSRQEEMAMRGVRLLVVTGDLVEGTITPKLLERTGPGMTAARKAALGTLPTAEEMGEAIAEAATGDASSGDTIVVGGALETLD